MADAIIERGIRVENAHFLEHGREVAAVSWLGAGVGVSPYSFVLSFLQDDHERFLFEQLAALGATVEWNTSLQSFEQDGSSVQVLLKHDNGEEVCEAAYLCGCDGAHTVVRPHLGIDFPGGTYTQTFYVADVAVTGPSNRDFFMHFGERSVVMCSSLLSKGRTGTVGGRHRIPWLGSNYATLAALDWCLHVYGSLSPALAQAAASLGVTADVFPWDNAAKQAGLGADAAYLIRPDGHVAVAMAEQDPAELRSFAAGIGLAARAGALTAGNAAAGATH